jgi:transposase
VEAAWAYRLQARVTWHLLTRQEGLPECVRQLAWKAQLRLCARYRRLLARGKTRQTIVIALARELAAFLWARGRAVAQTPA